MKFFMLKALGVNFLLISCISIQLSAQTPQEEIINEFFKAFNNSDFVKLTEVVSSDITITEGNFVLCNSIDQLKPVFQWDSVFVPEYKVLEMEVNGDVYDVVVSKIDKRVEFLHDIPMVSNVQFAFDGEQIKSQRIDNYTVFDVDKWRGRLNGVTSWVHLHYPELKGFERDISPEGAVNYIKAIDLYCNRELNDDEKIFVDKDLQLIHLKDSVFVHLSWTDSERWGRFSSNGLIVASQGKAIMIDTPMDNMKTERLYNYLKDKMNIEVEKLIPGHYHDDCIGGIEFLHSKGVQSLANILTVEKCIKENLPAPQYSFTEKKELDFYGKNVQCAFWGGGHSFDNIVIWLPKTRILFGGCLIKSENSRGLGNLSNAVVEEWDSTVKKLQDAYPEVKVVVPGHGNYGGSTLLTHTIELVKTYKKSE